jgi:hypothetical protein
MIFRDEMIILESDKNIFMPLVIPTEKIKEIADYLDSGMLCFLHKSTGELEYYPDESRGHAGFDEEVWQDVIDKVEDNSDEYIGFEPMDSHESFEILEAFVATIEDERIRQRFEDAISYKKPFQNFKQLLPNYPELRQQWFDFKNKRYVEWVGEQLERYNSLEKMDED